MKARRDGQAPSDEVDPVDAKATRLFAALGSAKRTMAQAKRAGQLMGVSTPSRNTIVRRWKAQQQASFMDLAMDPRALIAPGKLTSSEPLALVQIDHTLADVIVVDERSRERWKRPWLSIALDIATTLCGGLHFIHGETECGC